MSAFRKSVVGFLWNHLSKVADFGLGYLLGIVIARLMGAQDYSVYVSIMSVVSLLLLIVSGGFDESLAKYVPQYVNAGEGMSVERLAVKLLGVRSSLIGLVAMAIYLLRGPISVLFNNPRLDEYMGVLIAYMMIQSLINFFSSFSVARFRTRPVFIITAAMRITNIVCTVLLLRSGMGLGYVIASFSVVGLLALFGYFLLSGITKVASGNTGNLRPVFVFSISMLANTFIAIGLGKYPAILLLSHFFGPSVQIAYFDVAYSLELIIEYCFALGFAGMGLTIASDIATRIPSRLGETRRFVMQYYQLFVIPVVVFCFAKADSVIATVYSDKYLQAVPVFRTFLAINSIGVVFLARDFNATILFSLGKERLVLLIRTVIGVSSLVVNYFVVSRFGALGAITVVGVAFLVTTLIEYVLLSATVGFGYDLSFVLKVTAVSLLAAAVVEGVGAVVSLSFPVVGLLYCLLVFAGYMATRLHQSGIFSLFREKMMPSLRTSR